MRIRIQNDTKYRILMALLVFSIWAFNETKVITYPVKILYILLFGYYSISHMRVSAKYQYWCILMVILSIIASLIAPSYSNPMYEFINMLQVFLIGFVTYGYLDSEIKTENLLKMFVFGGIILAIRLVIKTPVNVWFSWQRLGEAIGSNANDVGNKAAISAIIALCLAKNFTKRKRLAYFIAFGILGLIVLFSGSRKALIAVVVGSVLLYTIGLQNKKKLFFSLVGIGVALVLIYSAIMNIDILYQTIGRRIETMINVFFYGGSEASSIDLREKYVKVAWELIKKNPIQGIGLGSFLYVSGIGVYSHCDYTEVACSYGLIGAFVFYLPLLLGTIKYALLKNKSDVDYICLIMQIILLITFVTMVMYTSVYVQILVAMFVARYKMNFEYGERNMLCPS